MAKKMRFALQMKDGIEVKTLSELQEHFDMDCVMEYYSNGKLETWLDDRYYEEAADQIRELNLQDPELSRKLCEIFHVKYAGCADSRGNGSEKSTDRTFEGDYR